jgi:hypothetical protein
MRAVAVAAGVSLALVASYLALGGASYAPAKVADPCEPRDWRVPQGFEAVVEQVALSAVDGAACELGVSREDVVLAFADSGSLEAFADARGLDEDAVEGVARAALVRAVGDAARAGALGTETAELLRSIARRIPVSRILDLLELLPDG